MRSFGSKGRSFPSPKMCMTLMNLLRMRTHFGNDCGSGVRGVRGLTILFFFRLNHASGDHCLLFAGAGAGAGVGDDVENCVVEMMVSMMESFVRRDDSGRTAAAEKCDWSHFGGFSFEKMCLHEHSSVECVSPSEHSQHGIRPSG